MKKILLTLTAAGVLAVPLGVVLAGDDPIEPVDPAPANTDPDQVQDRERRSADDPVAVATEDRQSVVDCDEEGVGPMLREREQHRLEQRVDEGTGAGPMLREREQHRLEQRVDEDTPAVSDEGRAGTAPDDGAQLQLQYGEGAARSGR